MLNFQEGGDLQKAEKEETVKQPRDRRDSVADARQLGSYKQLLCKTQLLHLKQLGFASLLSAYQADK